jgi:hypothetical protein
VDVRVQPQRSVFRSRLVVMAHGTNVPNTIETRYGTAPNESTHFRKFGAIVVPLRERRLGCEGHDGPPAGMWMREWVYDLVEQDLNVLDAEQLLRGANRQSWAQDIRLLFGRLVAHWFPG